MCYSSRVPQFTSKVPMMKEINRIFLCLHLLLASQVGKKEEENIASVKKEKGPNKEIVVYFVDKPHQQFFLYQKICFPFFILSLMNYHFLYPIQRKIQFLPQFSVYIYIYHFLPWVKKIDETLIKKGRKWWFNVYVYIMYKLIHVCMYIYIV